MGHIALSQPGGGRIPKYDLLLLVKLPGHILEVKKVVRTAITLRRLRSNQLNQIFINAMTFKFLFG
jgi:hypothetical protein